MSGGLLCTFYVEGLLLGIPVDRVEEVLAAQTVTAVPLAHRDVAGLLNLRGQIVTAIDARRRLGLAARDEATEPTIVVIRSDGETVSLLVDRAGDVVDVEGVASQDVPVTVSATIRDVTVGAYQLGGQLLLVLDADQTLAVSTEKEAK